MTIHLLSEETINKIAAGEVIENPASVVKELVENAMDAGGDSINVAIERGGFSLIRVIDNGTGMCQDDLLLSVERHATSKIRSANDLSQVLTMGFRGEALASIGSVSKMKILTAIGEKGEGTGLCVAGRKLFPPFPISRNRGTTIEVRALFYNVPARLKFQKSPAVSQQTITKWLIKLSLAHPDKTFRYFSDGKEVMHLLPGSLEERVSQTIGPPFVKEALNVKFSKGGIKIEGLIGSPMDAKSNRLGQHIFVNGRAITSLLISTAIKEGYGTRLRAPLHPIYVLHLTLPPDWVDVNVHPQKKEVCFREEKTIQGVVRESILNAFNGSTEKSPLVTMEWRAASPLKLQETRACPDSQFSLNFPLEKELPVVGLSGSYLILHPTSLIDLPNEGGIYLIDLERAATRILYERFLRADPSPMQSLLFPKILELTLQETQRLLLHLEELKRIGVLIRPFGEKALIVEALTPDIEEEKLQPLLEECAQVFDERLALKEREKKLALSAVFIARSQRKMWALVEAKQIAQALFKTHSPYYCPKGKRTIVALNHETIQKLFEKKSGSTSKSVFFKGG